MGEENGTSKAPLISRRGLLIGGGVAVGAVAVGFAASRLIMSPAQSDGEAGDQRLGSPAPAPPSPVEAMLAASPFTVAHRGGSLNWPESSLYAYDQASTFGVNALEMSVVRTLDGVWFGAHDVDLDRAAGTTGFVVAEHPWSDVQQLSIIPPAEQPNQDPQPFVRVEEFIDRYRDLYALWIDPKAVHRKYYDELMSIMVRRVPSPPDVFVAKCDATITEWGDLAQENGIESWGFYYGRNMDADPASFDDTQASWTMLGLDMNASNQQWNDFTTDGRPVVAHVLNTHAQREIAIERGANGLMISGVQELLGS